MKRFVEGYNVFVHCMSALGSSKSLLAYCILSTNCDFWSGTDEQFNLVVVSPLISLMKAQVWTMNEREIRAMFVGDSCIEEGAVDACNGKLQMVILTSKRWFTSSLPLSLSSYTFSITSLPLPPPLSLPTSFLCLLQFISIVLSNRGQKILLVKVKQGILSQTMYI